MALTVTASNVKINTAENIVKRISKELPIKEENTEDTKVALKII